MDGPITLVITNLTPVVEEALSRLLQALEPADVKLSQKPQGVPRESGPPRLDELWLTDSLVYKCADAVGITRNLASRMVQQVRVAIGHSARWSPRGKLLAPEFANARLSDGASGRVNAADFVALATNDRVVNSLRACSDREHPFGSGSVAAAKAMAEYLQDAYSSPA